MAIEVSHPLEVNKIEKEQTEGKIEAPGAFELALGDRKQMPVVLQAGAVIGDRQLLDTLHGTYVLNGNRGVVAQNAEKGRGFRSQRRGKIVHQLDHTESLITGAERDADG